MKKYYILILNLCLIHFLLGFDINIVSVSLPSISSHFNISANVASRIVWVYFLVLTCLLLVFGKVGDLKGYKKIYLWGIVLFLLGTILCYFSGDFNLLVISRIIQSLGSAVLFALTPAIIAAHIPLEFRGKVYGMNYSFTALGGIIGRAGSGFLIDGFGWNSIFIVSLPIILVTLFITYKYFNDIKFAVAKIKFDFLGTVLISVSLFLFLFAVNNADSLGWNSLEIVLMLIVSIVFIIVFVLYELKIPNPLFNFEILKIKNISFSVLSFISVYIITNGMIYITPFLLLWVKNYPKKETGLLIAIPSLLQFFSGYISGNLSDKFNSYYIRLTGLILISISVFLYFFITPETNIILIILILSIYGFSIGFFIPANTNSIMTSAPLEQKGIVSSFMTTSIRLGSAIGVVFFGAVFSLIVPEKNPIASGIDISKINLGFKYTFIFGCIIGALGIISTLLTKKNK